MRVFHFFNRLLTSRIAVGLVLFVALALLVWYGGPELAIDGAEPLASRTNRLIAIAVLAVLFLGLEAFRRWRLGRLNRRILSSLGSIDEAPGPGDRTGRVREGYMMLCEALRTHGGARARRRLHEQPWYLVLGETGSGRSTALAGSGLEFVVETGRLEPFGGRGPERGGECGWWVTEEAVFVIAPGDFVTEPDRTQAAEWGDLLDCLRSSRRRHPLSGIILTMPATSLLYEGTAIRIAGQMRQRLQEAVTRLRSVPPVYFLVTKCDRIAGFTEYFSSLNAEERSRPLGVTLPLERSLRASRCASEPGMPQSGTLSGTTVVAAFTERYREFIAGLANWIPYRLEAERDTSHRCRIFGFPQQMQALGEPIQAVVRRIFRPGHFRRGALFRGVYFASARQRGPITDIVARVHRQVWDLAVPEPPKHDPERATSFFLDGLFQNVILPERRLVARDPAVRRRWLVVDAGILVLGGIVAAALGASLWLGSLYAERQSTQVSHALVAHRISRAAVPENDFVRAALAVAPLRTASRPIEEVGGEPTGDAGWGPRLRRGANRLGTHAGRVMLRIPSGLSERMDAAYAAAAYTMVRPAVVRELGEELRSLAGADQAPVERLRERLGLYLGLADSSRFDADALREWAGWHARGRFPLSREAHAQVVDAVAVAFDARDKPYRLDAATVAAARERLRMSPGAEIHARMKDDARELVEITIGTALGERMAWVLAQVAPGMSVPSVPGYFSEPGYYEQFLPNAPRAIRHFRRNDWLVGEDAAATPDEQFFAEVGELYARDYVAAWRDFLDDLALPKVATAAQAMRLMESLLSSESPLDGLVRMVAEHTVLPVVRGSEENATGGPGRTGETGGGVLDAVNGKTRDAIERQYAMWPGDAVRREFTSYHALRDERTGNLPGLAEIRSRLGALHSVIAAVNGEPDPDEAAFRELRRWIVNPREAEVNALRRVTTAQPQTLRRMLADLSDQSLAILTRSARRHLGRHWRDTAHDECRRAISGRYPIDRKAGIAIAPRDFEAFFTAGGTVDRFFRERIEPFVDTTAEPWKERGLHGRRIGLRDEALEMFRNAVVIRDAFGLDAGTLGSAGFMIEPVHLDSNALWVTVETNHETFTYRHEPPRRFRMKVAEEAVSISIAHRTGSVHVSRLNAPWAWLRMFDRFRLQPAGVPDQFDFKARVGGLKAGFRISADSTINPLAARTLTEFRCEERLL